MSVSFKNVEIHKLGMPEIQIKYFAHYLNGVHYLKVK